MNALVVVRVLLVTIALATPVNSFAQATADGMDWREAPSWLTDADRQDILALLKRLRLQPRRVDPPPAWVLIPCPIVTIETVAVADGRRRLSRLVSVMNVVDESMFGVKCPLTGSGVTRVGKWAARRAEIIDVVKWHIAGPGLAIDVHFKGDVIYEDARRIVMAINARTWIEKRTDQTSDPVASEIGWVIREGDGSYKVGSASDNGASEESWDVRLNASDVEIVKYSLVMY